MPQVVVPAPYRGPTQGQARVDVSGATVRECILAVEGRYPGFAEQVFDGAGKLHRFVSLFVNGDEIEREALDRSLSDADRIEILAAIAGG